MWTRGGEGVAGKSSTSGEEGDWEETKVKDGEEGTKLTGRGVAGIRQGGMCPKGESWTTSYRAEFEKDR